MKRVLMLFLILVTLSTLLIGCSSDKSKNTQSNEKPNGGKIPTPTDLLSVQQRLEVFGIHYPEQWLRK